MYLKRLQVQGFKTFANRTEFLFNTGMAAIVGPNGSGKSNVADAIRWVLGEQRYSTLRGKKTEDVIFAGSTLKTAMGFAEASITFDNADRILPLDFGEVTITRRAYRTGENEYFINKSRVRLKDISEAVAALSQTYTVITQGMVDAALSQKPEERRGLFEDAAAIGLYNLKKVEAESSLAKTDINMKRVADLVSEIKPRLKGLEQHAKQAEEFYNWQGDLQRLLKKWYGQRWRSIQAAIVAASQNEAAALSALNLGKQDLTVLQSQLETVRQTQAERRTQLGEHHHASSDLHNRAQQLQQRVAVDQEKLNGLVRQHENLQPELLATELAIEGGDNRLTELEQEYSAVQSGQTDERENLMSQEAIVRRENEAVQQANQDLNRQREEILKFNGRLEALKSRSHQLAERRIELSRQHEKYLQGRQQAQIRQHEIETEMAQAGSVIEALEQAMTKLTAQHKTYEAQQSATQEKARQHERSLAEARTQREATSSRLDLLIRLQSSFTGYYGGVKAVMQAAQLSRDGKTKLPGIVGLVANLVQVPAELETAIETALGGHLQDVVVESFRDAEAAISLLKTQGAGRATFLPLDSLKVFGASHLGGEILGVAGVRGLATTLIEYAADYKLVYEQLLGRVVVVEDLPVARSILAALPNGWMVVTLGGETVRSAGAVTGGANGKDKEQGGMLMRERELRELPHTIAKLERTVQNASTALATEQTNLAALKQQLTVLEREAQNLSRNQQQSRDKLAQLKAQSNRQIDEMKVREENHQNVVREQAELDQRETDIQRDIATTEKNREAEQAKLKNLERALRIAQATENDEREQLAALKTAQALSEQRLRTSAANLQAARSEQNRRQEQLQMRQSQLQVLEKQERELHLVLQQTQFDLATLSGQLETLRTAIVPLETELQRLEQTNGELERHWKDLNATLLTLEAAHGRASLETQRVQTELETLKLRAADDLAPTLNAASGTQTEISFEEWEQTDEPELNPKETIALTSRIEQLRAKVRRIGAVNPLAMQEWRETKTRYDFLNGQLTDLEQTAESLRVLIRELDLITQQKFAATFDQVAGHFSKYFGLLFNGGTAKLSLTTPDNISQTGIEILAQPPGKRQQNLNLLSGGERALTAVALLFALLEVNPTPFCVMDEVDAALDEANVGRFCETLKKLADRTQFIVITHNRATIEAAHVLYGISMGADSVSKVISLKIEEALNFKDKAAKAPMRATKSGSKIAIGETS